MATEPVEFPSQRLPLCVACRRLRRPVRGRRACAAFPGGVPAPLLDAAADHREPYPGDQGIRFEPDRDAPDSVPSRVTARRGTVAANSARPGRPDLRPRDH
jgi:hypothetical protein